MVASPQRRSLTPSALEARQAPGLFPARNNTCERHLRLQCVVERQCGTVPVLIKAGWEPRAWTRQVLLAHVAPWAHCVAATRQRSIHAFVSSCARLTAISCSHLITSIWMLRAAAIVDASRLAVVRDAWHDLRGGGSTSAVSFLVVCCVGAAKCRPLTGRRRSVFNS